MSRGEWAERERAEREADGTGRREQNGRSERTELGNGVERADNERDGTGRKAE